MLQGSACARLVFPLDVSNLNEAQRLIRLLSPHVGVFKVGLELFTAAGPPAIEAVHRAGAACFLDLKLHDIPATVAKAVDSACGLGVRYLTLHAANGSETLRGAARIAEGGATRLLAVTVLTSMDADAIAALGVPLAPAAWVKRLARLSLDAGLRGFVTSPEECAALRSWVGRDSLIVTPGIRPAGAAIDDQKRIATPAEAIRRGADLLVIGRPIRSAVDPAAAAAAIAREIAGATAGLATP